MTLPAYLDAVEQGRIPADEIAHETRIARNEMKRMTDLTADACGYLERLIEAVAPPPTKPVRGDLMVLCTQVDNLICWVREQGKEALAEAVRAEREACAQWHDTEAERIRCSIDPLTVHQIGAIGDHEEAALAIRSRPSPDVAVVPAPIVVTGEEINESLLDQNAELRAAFNVKASAENALLAEIVETLRPFATVAARDIGDTEEDVDIFRPMSARNAKAPPLAVGHLRKARTLLAKLTASQPSAPPPDLAAMRRVVEAAGVYVASRASVPARGEMWRTLRAEGWPIISSWIDEDGEGQTHDMGELWSRIEQEVCASVGLVLYVEADDFPLKGALVEVGMALAFGRRVVVVAPGVDLEPRSMRPIGSWMRHPRVSIEKTPQNAMCSLGVARAQEADHDR